MKPSVCIDMMFSYLPFYERFAAVKAAGLSAVEFWRWSNKDLSRVKQALSDNGLTLSVMNIDVADNEVLSNELSRGILNARRADDLIRALRESAPVCRELGCEKLIVLIGETIETLSEKEQLTNIEYCLSAAAPVAEELGVTLVVEPLNRYERNGYFLTESDKLGDILRRVGSDRVKMLFDIYHQQRMEGNLIGHLERNIDVIGHIHVADSPLRTEPGTGEINYPNVLSALCRFGYDGFVGLEYRATKRDEETFGFLREVGCGKA